MRTLTIKDGDILSHFDKIDESEAEIEKISPKHHLIISHDVAADKTEFKRQKLPERNFGFCRTFEKNTKHLGFHLTFKTTDLQDFVYTTLGDNTKVNFDKLFFTFQFSFRMLKRS